MSKALPRLKQLPRARKCYGCGVSFTLYRWSPHWCPACDKERIARIDRGFSEAIDALRQRATGRVGR
jgi:predicted RNA-binding Zn-ribbon protein involved in translation (DUF1610 family)